MNLGSEYRGNNKVHIGNGTGLNISNVGYSILSSSSKPKSRNFILKNLLHVPEITKNLISVLQFATDNHVFFEFHPHICLIKDQVTRQVLLRGMPEQGLYRFHLGHHHHNATFTIAQPHKLPSNPRIFSTSSSPLPFSQQPSKYDVIHWHQRLGHPTIKIINKIISSCHLSLSKTLNLCIACQQGKAHRLPYSQSINTTKSPLELIHTDL